MNITFGKCSWDNVLGYSLELPSNSGTFSSAWDKYFKNFFTCSTGVKVKYSRKEAAIITIFILPMILNFIKSIFIIIVMTVVLVFVIIILLLILIICSPILIFYQEKSELSRDFFKSLLAVPLLEIFGALLLISSLIFMPVSFLIAIYSILVDVCCDNGENINVISNV